jgi:hypothetical protein
VTGLEAPLLVAGATVDLTPSPGLPLGGYLLRQGKVASGTHDPLEASLVWVRDRQGGEVLWIGIDALCVDEELTWRIADAVAGASGCVADAVLVCASHTHSSAAGWVAGLGPMLPETADLQLRDGLVELLADAAGSLSRRLHPGWPVVSDGSAPGAGGNRNDSNGPHDASVGVLALVDGEGGVTATVVDYASHGTVLGHDNLAWSADWPGATRRSLAGALHGLRPFEASEPVEGSSAAPWSTVAFLQGAAGDASPRFVRRSQSFGEVDRLGGLVAAGALSATLQARPDESTDVRLSVRRATVKVPTRELPSPGEAQNRAEELERSWKTARGAGVAAPQERIARTRYEGALMLVALAEAGMPPTLELPIAAVALGNAAWIHLPVELFASFGLAIRERSPFPRTRVIGYTNGYFGYVADEAAHRDGVYEASASRFDARGGQVLVDAAVKLLRSLASETRATADPAMGVVLR